MNGKDAFGGLDFDNYTFSDKKVDLVSVGNMEFLELQRQVFLPFAEYLMIFYEIIKHAIFIGALKQAGAKMAVNFKR